MIRRLPALTVLFGLLSLGVPGAVGQTVLLQLKNGDRLTGTLLSEDTNRIVISNSWSKSLSVPLAEISRRENAAVATAPAAAAPASPVPPKPAPPPPKPPKYWHGELQMGADLQQSTLDRSLYYSRLRLNYARQRFRNAFDSSYAYGETEGVLSANRFDLANKTDFDLGTRLFMYNVAACGFDEIRLIDWRYELGPGLGYHLVKLTNFVLNAELGANYQVQEFSTGMETKNFSVRLAEDSVWKVNAKFSFDERFEFFPSTERFGEYRLRFETNLRYALWQNLSINLTVVDTYDTQPARGVTKNDLLIRSSIGVRF